mgnify:CR=1 FL=1
MSALAVACGKDRVQFESYSLRVVKCLFWTGVRAQEQRVSAGTRDGMLGVRGLTPEQLETQRQEMAKACARADVVITTAKLFGRRAPMIINNEVLKQMQPGSILVDLAVESGGNVEGSQVGEEVVTENGVRVLGPENLEGYYPKDATLMLASNFYNLIEHFWDKEAKDFHFKDTLDLLPNSDVGQVVRQMLNSDYEQRPTPQAALQAIKDPVLTTQQKIVFKKPYVDLSKDFLGDNRRVCKVAGGG